LVETKLAERRANGSGNMMPPFTPIEASAAEHSSAASARGSGLCRFNINSKVTEKARALRGQSASVGRQLDMPPLDQSVRDGDGNFPRQMVVTSSSSTQPLIARADVPHLPLSIRCRPTNVCGDRHDAFKHLGYGHRRKPVIPVPTLPFHSQKP
jgi:hypothetical protein